VLSGLAGQGGGTVQSCRCWLRRAREAVVWVQRGEAPPLRQLQPELKISAGLSNTKDR
jgi:hypothetical protein